METGLGDVPLAERWSQQGDRYLDLVATFKESKIRTGFLGACMGTRIGLGLEDRVRP